MSGTVCVAIVTYKRKDLLHRLLFALEGQTYPIAGIIVVNNYNHDQTEDMLFQLGFAAENEENKVHQSVWKGMDTYYYPSSVNEGGSGGFAKAFQIAKNLPYDYLWAMDDDVLPERDCLEKMMTSLTEEVRVCVPCRGNANFRDYAICRYDLKNPFFFHNNQCKRDRIYFDEMTVPYVEIEDMTFEGPLIERRLIDEIGIPNKDYFIFFDDTDYAHRLNNVTKIRYVRDALLHRMLPLKTSRQWTWRNYYVMRNSTYFDWKYGENIAVRYLRPLLRVGDLVVRAVLKGRFQRVKWLTRAYMDGRMGHMGKTYEPNEIVAR